MIRNVVISIVITVLVSLCVGFALAPLLGFKQSCLLGFILQVVGNWYYNDYKIRKNDNEREQILNDRLDILSHNYVKFDCPCGKHSFDEVIYLNNDNSFDCPQCEQQIKVNITLTPVIVTKIIDIQNTIKKIKELDIAEEI